jgi:hypothetical protein
MRVVAFRAFVRRAASGAVRASRALATKMRDLGLDIGRGVGVGGDESRFGGGRSRVWMEWVEEARARVLTWLEHSTFERFPRLRRAMRRLLGAPPAPPKPSPPESARPSGPLGAGPLGGPVDPAAQREVRDRQIEAHTRERAGLRDRMGRK